MGSYPESGSGYHPSAPLEVLGGQCQDLDKYPDIGQYIWVSYGAQELTLLLNLFRVACALSEVLLAAVQSDHREFRV